MCLLHLFKTYLGVKILTSSCARTRKQYLHIIPLNSNRRQVHQMSRLTLSNRTLCILSALSPLCMHSSLTMYFEWMSSHSQLLILELILLLSSCWTLACFAWVYSSWNCLSINDWVAQGRVIFNELKSASISFSTFDCRALSYWIRIFFSVVVELITIKEGIHTLTSLCGGHTNLKLWFQIIRNTSTSFLVQHWKPFDIL